MRGPSLWQNETRMLAFTTLVEHVEAVRWTIRRGGVVWSGVFDLRGPHHVPIVGWPNTAWRLGATAAKARADRVVETA